MTQKCRKFRQVGVQHRYHDDQHQQQPRLIPGLPDEIAIECLVRVPHQFHSTMKLVCNGWKNLISHPSFYFERRRSGAAEHLVALVQALPTHSPSPTPSPSAISDMAVDDEKPEVKYDPQLEDQERVTEEEEDEKSQLRQIQRGPPLYGLSIYNLKYRNWHQVVMTQKSCMQIGAPAPTEIGVPIPMFCQCVSLPTHAKLLLLGGWDPSTLEPVPDLYIIDLISGNWKKGSPMSMPRSFFACAVVGSSAVYVAGGHDSQKNALKSAEVYDVETDEWRILAPMAEERDECQGVSWEEDNRFWVVSGYGTDNQGRFRNDAEFYDPDSGSWSKIDGVWPFTNSSPRSTVATTAAATANNDAQRRQWWWWVAGNGRGDGDGDQQQQNMERGGGVMQFDWEEKRWKVASSISLPNGLRGSSVCATYLGGGGKKRIFVMGNGRDRAAEVSQEGCETDCGGGGPGGCAIEGAFLLEEGGSSAGGKCVYGSNGTATHRWKHIHTPGRFMGFPYSASHLVI